MGRSEGQPRVAWALVLLVVGAWLVALLVDGGRIGGTADPDATVIGATGAPAGGPSNGGAGSAGSSRHDVVVIGVPGLTWDLIDADRAPFLDELSTRSATAALILRGRHEVTCAADAWLTLGAGDRAGTDLVGCGDAGDSAWPVSEVVTPLDGGRGLITPSSWARWEQAVGQQSVPRELGTLADSLQETPTEGSGEAGAGACVAAYSPRAALAAAGPDGRVEHYAPLGLSTAADLRDECRLHLVETATVQSGDRGGLLAGVDADLRTLVDSLGPGTTVLVTGLGHTGGRAEPMALLLHTPDEQAGRLSSLTTRQDQLVQLTDLTVGVHQLLGLTWDDALAGDALVRTEGPDASARATDLAEAIGWSKLLQPWVMGAVGLVLVPALLVTTWLRRRGAARALAVTAMAVPAAAFAAGLVPWWRAGQPFVALTLVVLGLAGVIAAVALAGPWRRHPLGPPAVVAAATLVVLGVDVILGARLGLVSVLGLLPVSAGRFYGQGNVGFGVVLGAVLVLAAAVLALMPGRRVQAAVAVALLGVAATVVNAAPQAGADFGGVPTLVVAIGLIVMAALQVAWSPLRLLLLALGAGVAAAGVMVLDWSRGAGSRTHLGDFVQAIIDGTALGIVTRKLEQSLGILVAYPASWLAVVALVALGWIIVRRPRWTARLWELDGMRPVALASLVALVLAWVLNDSGIAAAGLGLTMLVAAAWAVLLAPAIERRP